mgnify:FL=1
MAMKKLLCTLMVAVIFSLGSVAFAAEPYQGYNYNSWSVSEPAPNAYEATETVSGVTAGAGDFASPQDMVYRNGELFILDSGNARVVVLDEQYRLKREYSRFIWQSEELTLNNPKGLYVSTKDRLYIADTDNARVLICDMVGNVLDVLKKPDSEVFPENIEFKPKRVIADKKGNVYVLCEDFFYGAILYDANGEFSGYFGANKVEVSIEQLKDRFWRLFMTDKQKSYLSQYVPTDYNSFDIDADDFIYTCSLSKQSTNELKKLNALGNNMLQAEITYDPLNKDDYGERERVWYNGKYIDSNLIDVDVSDQGFIHTLDFTYGRVYQYDQDSNLLTIFGGMGDQTGLFKMPAAVESIGADVLVLDTEKATVTVFSPTEYGELINKATLLYNDGYYGQAMEEWHQLLQHNLNSEQAHRGIGRAYLEQGNYKMAMEYLRLGQDRAAYSKAYGYYRTDVVKRFFPLVVTLIIALLLVFFFWERLHTAVRKRFPARIGPRKFIHPFTCMMHPVSGMEAVRAQTGVGQLAVSGVVILIWFLVSIIERQGTGFIFNLNRPEDLSLWIMATKTLGVFVLFTVCSWAVGSLNQGEGSYVRIVNTGACAVFPYVLATLFKAIASNFIVYEEGALLNAVMIIALLYTAFMVFSAVMTAHQYSGGKTAVSLLLTGFAIVVVLFVLVLLFSLIQQLSIFVMTLYNEIMFRI